MATQMAGKGCVTVLHTGKHPRLRTKKLWSSATGSGLFELFGRDFEQILGQIVSLRVNTRSIQIR